MNKAEMAIVALLFALLLVWGYSQRQQMRSAMAARPAAEESAAAAPAQAAPAGVATSGSGLPPDTALQAAPEAATAAPAPEAQEEESAAPERTLVLSNGVVRVTLSSKGGAIRAVELSAFRKTVEPDSGPLTMDFAAEPALALEGLPGAGARADYELEAAGADTARLTRRLGAGVTLTRTVRLLEHYGLRVTDAFVNEGSAAAAVPAHAVATGPMGVDDERMRERDSVYLGLDTLAAHGGEGVQHWTQSRFLRKSPLLALLAQPGVGPRAAHRVDDPVAWLAVKNKFFVQILTPPEDNLGFEVRATRVADNRRQVLGAVSGAVRFGERTLAPGDRWERDLRGYIGPKDYALLRKLGGHYPEIMEFGRWFGWICKILLPTLKGLHAVIPNYGVAIILLTLIVRIIFWPVTHKSTESMKKMQALQPLVTKIREKYKDKPQKMNQEIMALYKEHKVNPVSGCLPMLVQIPVFFALFTVLRSAVELRYASFLWIRDLSEPEGLFAGTRLFQMLPLVSSLNILPLLMTATTIWQQKLTPTSGDPQQQKMMMFMPIFMLFLFYNMASALVLYWTVSQVLSIVQMLWQQRRTGTAAPVVA